MRTKCAVSRVPVKAPTKIMRFLLEIPIWPDEASLYALSKKYKIYGMNIPTDCPVGEYAGKICWPTERDKAAYFKKKGLDYEKYKRNGGVSSAILE